MGLLFGHGAWQILWPNNRSMWNSYSFQRVGPWLGDLFPDIGAEGVVVLWKPCWYDYVANMPCSSVNWFNFSREKLSSAKSNVLTDQHELFCFNHASAFYTSNNVMKNVDEQYIQGTNSNRSPTGNLRCHVLASRALYRPCSFGQSARSVETGTWL